MFKAVIQLDFNKSSLFIYKSKVKQLLYSYFNCYHKKYKTSVTLLDAFLGKIQELLCMFRSLFYTTEYKV